MKKTDAEWIDYCDKNITAGYTPGGKKGNIFITGKRLVNLLGNYLQFDPGDTIVDIGCGNGRWAFGFLDRGVNYIGIDVIRPCIEFCKKAFADNSKYRFYHIDVKNTHYWACGTIEPEKTKYPIESGIADYVIAHSLFSHTGTIPVASSNLSEMKRILKPDGVLYSTWFLSPPEPGPDEGEKVTVYLRSDFEQLMKGFDILSEFPMPMGKQIAFLSTKRNGVQNA